MKTLIKIILVISSFLFLAGCGETLANMMVKTGMTPDMKIVTDKKIIKKRLELIERDTIKSTTLKSISPKDVIVFTKTPNFCKEIGWIIVKDPKGFNRTEKKKIGLFYNDVTVNSDIDALKNKAAKLGFNAIVVNYTPLSYSESLQDRIDKYHVMMYLIDKNIIRGDYTTYPQCTKEEEKKCKKFLHDKTITNPEQRKNKYYGCIMKCSLKHGEVKSKEVLYGGKALICIPQLLDKVKKGQTVTSTEIELNVAKVLYKIFKENEKKVNKNGKKDIFKF